MLASQYLIDDKDVHIEHVSRLIAHFNIAHLPRTGGLPALLEALQAASKRIQPESLAAVLYCYADLEDLRMGYARPEAHNPPRNELSSWGLASAEEWFAQFETAYLALLYDLIGGWLTQVHHELVLRTNRETYNQPEIEKLAIH